jgi:hypothetical protein
MGLETGAWGSVLGLVIKGLVNGVGTWRDVLSSDWIYIEGMKSSWTQGQANTVSLRREVHTAYLHICGRNWLPLARDVVRTGHKTLKLTASCLPSNPDD